MKEKANRTILITGVTRGLGRALAERMIEFEHQVLGCGRNTEAIETLCKQFGSPHDFDVVDVAQDEQVARWARRLIEAYGPPDLVINNAGLINSSAPLWEVPAEEVSRVVDVNIKGVINVIRHFTPAMIERKNGVIVNFSSTWGRSTAPKVAPYCATKWAIEGLNSSLSQELPRTMAAVAVNPGIIDTDMLRSCFGNDASSFISPKRWSEKAAPFLLALGADDNGRSLQAPN